MAPRPMTATAITVAAVPIMALSPVLGLEESALELLEVPPLTMTYRNCTPVRLSAVPTSMVEEAALVDLVDLYSSQPSKSNRPVIFRFFLPTAFSVVLVRSEAEMMPFF